MTLLRFWKLLKFSNVSPSFCCLASQRLQGFSGQLCFSSLSFPSVIWHTLFLPIASYMTVNLRALTSVRIQSCIPCPAAHQWPREALSHLLQSVVGSLQLICSCWERNWRYFSSDTSEVKDGEKQSTPKKGLFRWGGRFLLVHKVILPYLRQLKLMSFASYRTRSCWIGRFFIFWRFFSLIEKSTTN